MFKHCKSITFIVVLMGIALLLSACGSNFAEGNPYYYVLHEVTGKDYPNEVKLYIIDPFEGKVIIGAETSDFDEIPDLEEYEDTENSLYIEYNGGETDRFEKKSDSLWVSLDSGVEYDAQRKEGEFDYTPVKYEVPWIEDYEASKYLSGQTFTKHTGNGAERLVFVEDHTLIISLEDTLPPYIVDLDDFKDYQGNETIEFKNIELKDIYPNEFLVRHEGKELLKLIINDENLLETEDGTTYMKN